MSIYRKGDRAINGSSCGHPPYPPVQVCREALAFAGGKCEDCGESNALEAHRTWTHPLDAADDELQVLCRDCHRSKHTDPNGDFWVDAQDMKDTWFGYHGAMDKDD